MTVLSLLPLAAALNAGDLPEAERVKRLLPHFSPRPGQEVTLDERELRDLTRGAAAVKPGRLRGAIKITPPPGQCFIVQRKAARSDDYVCKPQTLNFMLEDIDRAGRITWRVTTGDGDFGTDISWQTPYRTAIVTPFDRDPSDPPTYRFIASCKTEKTSRGKRLKIGLFSGETWVVAFPEEETLAEQPSPIPNLFMHTAGGKVSVKDASKRKETEAGSQAAAEAGAPAPEAEAKKEPPPPPKSDKPKELDQDEDRQKWSIPARGSYEMGGNSFMPFGSVAPGGSGKCRYNYRGSDEDPGTGRLECHEVDGFRHVLLPLTCLKELR